MQDNNNSSCSGGLEIVQVVKMRAYPGVKMSPYKANFGTDLKFGTSTTSWSKDVLGVITDQENLKMF